MSTDTHGVVLVVDHEPGVAELQRLYLSREGFDVRVETDPARAPEAARETKPDVVVLGGPAVDLYRQVEEVAGSAPIVCVVASETAAAGRYHVTRPFSPRVLVQAVGEALRGGNETPPVAGTLEAGAVRLDLGARSASTGAGRLSLTATEFDLLAFLVRHPGRVYTREQLLAAVWGAEGTAGTRTVDVHIAQLRAKLGAASPIRTVRGVGYAVDP